MIKKILILLILICSVGFSQSTWITTSVMMSDNPPTVFTQELPFKSTVRIDPSKIVVYSKPIRIYTIRKFYDVYETPTLTSLIMNGVDQSGKQVYIQLVERNENKDIYLIVEYPDYLIMFKMKEWSKN